MTDMSDEMWGLVLDRSKNVWEESRGLRKVRVKKPTLDESTNPLDAERVVIKVLYTGVCGSDKGVWFRNAFKDMIYDSLDEERKDIRITGHELLGRVVEAGSLADRHYGFRPGDIVTAESHITCGKCLQCRLGQREVCQDNIIIGFSIDGCFAEYIKLPAEVLWHSNPEKIRMEVGAIQEPFGNAVHVCTKVDLRGKSLAIFGCGTIGMLTALTAKALGVSRIIGIEPSEENATLAERIGVDEVVRFKPGKGWQSDPEVVEKVRRFGGDGVDVAIEMAGFNSSVNNAIESVRMGGDVVLFGIKSGDFTIADFSDIVVRGIAISSVIGRRIFETWNISTNLLEAKENKIQDKIFDVILNGGKDTIIHIDDYDPDDFERRMMSHPKLIVKWS
jgi:threonine 3-dehydrogenase